MLPSPFARLFAILIPPLQHNTLPQKNGYFHSSYPTRIALVFWHLCWHRIICCVCKRLGIYGTVLGTKAPNTAPYFERPLKSETPCAAGISGRSNLSRMPFTAPTLSPAFFCVVKYRAKTIQSDSLSKTVHCSHVPLSGVDATPRLAVCIRETNRTRALHGLHRGNSSGVSVVRYTSGLSNDSNVYTLFFLQFPSVR